MTDATGSGFEPFRIPTDQPVRLKIGGADLGADLYVPNDARGIVLFAHGSGSSRRSPRNRQVARELQAAGFGTLLFDLLTFDEERRDAVDASLRFDIPLLTGRLVAVIDALPGLPDCADLPVGLFGASTGAAAALGAAAERPNIVRSVVSRGGRPDLTATERGDPALDEVRAPVLLIVGGRDHQVIALNEWAAEQLNARHELLLVPGATHLFEEFGALDQVSRLAIDWFTKTLTRDTD
jgi:putative phosphoribosyl transferase